MNRLRQLGLFLLAVFVHIQSLTYWFVAIDTPKLIASSRVQGPGDIIEVLTRPMMHGTGFTDIALFYRPVSSFSYALDYWVWGLSPVGYHLTNLVLHGVATVLVALVVAEMTGRSSTGQLTGVLFALHPLMAEIVPAAARRHDIVMAIFMLGSLLLFIKSRNERGTRRRRLLGGALVMFAFALGAKEPALMVPGLVFVWTALQQVGTDRREALRTVIRDVTPFAVVTLAYLAVRFAVLGELGGYRQKDPISPADGIRISVEYVISLVYPSDVIGVGVTAGGIWLVVLLVLVVVFAFVCLCSVSSFGGSDLSASVSDNTLLLAGFVGGIVAIPLVIAWFPLFGRDELGTLVYLQPQPFHSYVYPSPLQARIGLILLGSCLIGVLWALISRPSTITDTERNVLAFFSIWLLLPLVLAYQSGVYTIRTGYVSVIPAMAILSVLLISGYCKARTIGSSARLSLDQNAALVGIVLLLIVPMVATSPLFHSYNGWEAAGETNQLTLRGLTDELDGMSEDTTVKLIGLPSGIEGSGKTFPRVKSIVYLDSQASQAWLELQRPNREITVIGGEPSRLQRAPERISFNTTRENGRVIVRLRYDSQVGHVHDELYTAPGTEVRTGPIRSAHSPVYSAEVPHLSYSNPYRHPLH